MLLTISQKAPSYMIECVLNTPLGVRLHRASQPAIINCSKLTKETLGQGVKYVQS